MLRVVQVIDVSDLKRPRSVAWYEPEYGGVHNVWVTGDTLYMGAYNAGFRAFDVSGELRGDLRLAEENYGRAAASYKKDNEQFMLDVSRVREKLGDYQGALTTLEEYLAMMERKHVKPDWSDERLSSLKQKLAASQKP
jgi:hypothetical protein